MITSIVCRLIFLILFGSLTLIRRAESDNNDRFGRGFGSREEARKDTLQQLFPNEGESVDAMKSLIYDGNIQKVVTILQNNVKQWSFIESQLLEPNVNIGMPEIFIPLKHLTTALELLGNVFVSRNEYSEARSCLERACPLMELLPASVLETEGSGDIQSVLGAGKNSRNAQNTKVKNEAKSNQYAAGCFALLKEVYQKLYEQAGRAVETLTSSGPTENNNNNDNFDKLYPDSRPSVVFVPVDHQLNKKTSTSASVAMTTESLDPSKIPEKIQSLRMSKANSLSTFLSSNRVALSSSVESLTSDHSNYPEEDHSSDWINEKITELRLPFDHIRSADRNSAASDDLDLIRQLMKQSEGNSGGGGGGSMRHSFILKQQSKSNSVDSDYDSESLSDKTIKNILFGSSDGDNDDASISLSTAMSNNNKRKSKRSESSLSTTASSSVIASDLENLLRKFVNGDKATKTAIIKKAISYYEEFDLKHPEMEYSAYAANMDFGQVFIEVMTHIAEEDFGWLGNELLQWSDNNGKLIDEKMFRAITPHERNRLLVLMAFDVAYSEEQDEDSISEDQAAVHDIHSLFELAASFMSSTGDPLSGRKVPMIQPRRSKENSNSNSGGGAGGGKSKGKKQRNKSVNSGEGSSSEEASAVNSAALNRLEREVTAALYEELLGNVDIATLRSSVPMLSADNDWTLFIFYLVVIVSVVIVVQLLYVDSQRKKTRLRQRNSNTLRKSLFGVPFVDNLLYFQPEESEMSGEGTIASSLATHSSSILGSNPTGAAAVDAIYSIWSICVYLSRVVLWAVFALFQLFVAGVSFALSRYQKSALFTSSGSAASSSSNASTSHNSNKTKGSSGSLHSSSKSEVVSSLINWFEYLKSLAQMFFTTSNSTASSSDEKQSSSSAGPKGSFSPNSSISVEITDAKRTDSPDSSTASASSAVANSGGAAQSLSSASSPLKARVVSDSALDEALISAFANESTTTKAGKKQTGVSFSSNLIAPSVHVSARNGLAANPNNNSNGTKKPSALKQSSNNVSGAAVSSKAHISGVEGFSEGSSAANHKLNVADEESKHRVVSKIAGKTILTDSLLPSNNNSSADGDFTVVNKEKRNQKDKLSRLTAAPQVTHIAHSGYAKVNPSLHSSYRKNVVDASSVVEEKRSSSLPSTPMSNNSGITGSNAVSGNRSFFSEVSPAKSLPPPPPLRTVHKVSPEIKGVSVTNTDNSSRQPHCHSELLLPPVRTTPALQSLDYSLLSQSNAFTSNSITSHSVAPSNDFGFGLPTPSFKPSIAPPPGIGAANNFFSNKTVGLSLSNTNNLWSNPKSPSYLDDFDYDNGIIEATDAFLDGLSDFVQSPVAPRPPVSGSGGSLSTNTSTALQSLTPPVRQTKQSSVFNSNTSSITIEAMYDGLSPDAPSFQPGVRYNSVKILGESYPSVDNSDYYSKPENSQFEGYYDNNLYSSELYDNLMSDLDAVILDTDA